MAPLAEAMLLLYEFSGDQWTLDLLGHGIGIYQELFKSCVLSENDLRVQAVPKDLISNLKEVAIVSDQLGR